MVRFDKPCIKVAGAVEYFREHMAVGDYLSQEGRAEMTWAGQGATRLGLSGQCQLDQFENLCRGLHPLTGEKLMVRDKGSRRRVCYFGQISPPKDVSLLYLVGGDTRIGKWWEEAVAETLAEIEACTSTRVRQRGADDDRATGNMVTALVTHDASRALDPQLHTHLCIFNITYDEAEKRWKSVQPSAFFRHQGYFREVCYNALARRMVAAGYTLSSLRGLGFNVEGVPVELRERFSKRRREVLAQARATGATSQDALQTIAAESRAAKTTAAAAELKAAWRQEAGEHLWTLEHLVAATEGRSALHRTSSAGEALDSAVAHVFERRSVVEDRLLLREALVAGRGQVELSALKRALASLERSGELLRRDTEVASRLGLESEREFTSWAHARLEACGPLGRTPATRQLSSDQRAAVRGILESRSGVVILQGDAGTGKTRCLGTIVEGIGGAGGRVLGCAPSAGAADVLRRELTADAHTLQLFLASPGLQREARGRVLIVDEAGLVSVREMRELCRLAARNDNRLLLVGDIKQHHSVEAGDALRCLQEYARVPVFRLTEIRRQQEAAYRQAVARLAAGDAYGAFTRFDLLGAVHELGRPAALFAAAAADYVRTVREGRSCLAISPVWSEIHEFNRAVRRLLLSEKLLLGEEQVRTTVQPLKWTAEERRRISNYQPGDVLCFHRAYGPFPKHAVARVIRVESDHLVIQDYSGAELRLDPERNAGFTVGLPEETAVAKGDRLLLRANLKEAQLRNGDIVEVTGFTRDGGIELRDGRTIPASFPHFTHGYAATSHASQGKTIDRGILLMSEAGIAAGNLKQAYVSNSRFRGSQAIYTTDKAAAREAMMRSSDRKLAVELVGFETRPRRTWRANWAKLLGHAPSVKAA